MIIGVPKEIKVHEYRVGMVPGGVKTFVERGHRVLIERGAGLGSSIRDEDYRAAGGVIVQDAEEVWGQAEMIVKVKEPIEPETSRMRPGQILYTYLHLAAVPELALRLIESQVTAVAYETIELADRRLPLLQPMSEVAGRMSIQVGARCLEREYGGAGVLLGGVPGVPRGKVVIIGGGVVGTEAAKIAMGMGALVTILDINTQRLGYLDDVYGGRIQTIFSNPASVAEAVSGADLVVGAVLLPGARAPHLVTEAMIKEMKPGSVVVDVSIDQGGCIATARPTTHEKPTYVLHDVVHYCVTNMPGAVPRTSTFALTNVTLKYGLALADLGLMGAVERFAEMRPGVNVHEGCCRNERVAESLNLPCRPLDF
ncbi:MAG: alanine dehydrogenase [Bradymonadales bacterium]|nr:alanine dehydrogenase [Bradymonadales bacterium]